MRLLSCLALIALVCSACAGLQRSGGSGYGSKQPETYDSGRRADLDGTGQRAAYEMGLDPNSNLSSNERGRIDSRLKVRGLEKNLHSKKEREQYSKVLPWFRGDDEKIEFLELSGLEARQQWINAHGIWDRAKMPAPEMKELIETQDISVGMPRDYVKKSWGDPQAVEVSGNPIYHNERWKYQRFVSTPDGYKKETRFVYFESGRVVGWETE